MPVFKIILTFPQNIALGLLMEDAQNFVSMVVGYYHIFVDRDKRILEKTVGKSATDPHGWSCLLLFVLLCFIM